MTAEFTENWFDPSVLEIHLSHLKDQRNLKFLEIGTFEGKSAVWMLDNFACSVLTIDPCITDPIEAYADKINPSIEKRAIANLSGYGDRAMFYKRFSEDLLPQLPLNFYDFIFIDGDHRRAAVAKDSKLAWPLLRDGGIMIWDDYTWQAIGHEGDPEYSPKLAIDEFLEDHIDFDLDILHRDYKVVVRKRHLNYVEIMC